MVTDADLLSEAPDFLTVTAMLKALPVEEGGHRLLYMEASNEGLDQTQEVVLAKALAEQAGFYRKYGNVDIDHFTVIGAKHGIPDYLTYEIGKPLDVQQRDGVTFVKAQLFQGEGPMAAKANMVWDSIYKLKPAQRWYPSVGGSVLHKSIAIDRDGNRRTVIDKVRWQNIGLSKTPANQHVQGVSVVPIEVFAKSLMAGGEIDWTLQKTLTASYATDHAGFEGQAALRKESLDGSPRQSRDDKDYWHFREWIARAVRDGAVGHETGKGPDSIALVAHTVREFGVSQDTATEWVERFLGDLRNGLSRRKGTTQ